MTGNRGQIRIAMWFCKVSKHAVIFKTMYTETFNIRMRSNRLFRESSEEATYNGRYGEIVQWMKEMTREGMKLFSS